MNEKLMLAEESSEKNYQFFVRKKSNDEDFFYSAIDFILSLYTPEMTFQIFSL